MGEPANVPQGGGGIKCEKLRSESRAPKGGPSPDGDVRNANLRLTNARCCRSTTDRQRWAAHS